MESGNDLIFKNALEQFADPQCGILDASLNLLKQIVGADKFTLGSQKPRIFKDLCARREVSYQQILKEVVDNIKSTYYVARLDERAFSHPTDAVELDKALEDASQEKYKGILIFAIDVDENTKLNRTLAAELTRVFNKLSNNPVILFIRQGVSLSISTCERKAKKRDVGEKMGKVNLLQGINCSKLATGHLRILGNLQINSKIRTFDALYEHWFEVFNTKTLTDKFYKELYSWYMWVVNDPNTHFPENGHLPEHENEKKNVKIIRLITRLLFVWFIKAKKVKKEGQLEMGLVPEKLFETDELKAILNDFDPNSATDGEFYNAILQNLFFATLNNEVNSRRFVDTSNAYRSKKGYTVKNLYRDNKDKSGSWFKISHDEVLDLFKTVPFLNCGLFECLDKYKRTDINYDVDRIFDGFSTKSGDKFRACLPNRLFFADELPEITIQVTEKGEEVPLKIKSKGLINLLNEYVFTVEENTPLDQQVSLDPELLGKVFENLLAAFNPETEESVRKSSGSYYTPREIVEYMVNESLIQYLKTNLNADESTEAQLRNLVNPSNPDFKLNANQPDAILEALYHCKILDPACGSGAFPMGMLQQMVHIISRLDDKNEKWQKLITKKAKEETAKAYENKELDDEERKKIIADIESSFTNSKNNPDYTRKLYLIQNCIFGVDIQPIAMMISKLRFFISLICEQDENAIDFDKKERNFGIHTLPNLETKFVAANSLLTPDVRKFTCDWTNDEHLDQLKNDLMELRYRHVTARSLKDKMEIRTHDDEKRQEINDYILSTQAHADPVKIAMFEDQIAHLMLERKLYEGENIVEEYVDMQGDLFADSERMLVRKDTNRAKRDEIDRQIHICQAQIDHEKAKENITGFEAAVKQLTEWNPYDQVKSSPFFDPDWMFGITDGFDIVIGNPPYIGEKGHKELFDPVKRCNSLGKFYLGKMDYFYFFFHFALNNLCDKGVCALITTNYYPTALGARKLRKDFSERANILQLINFNEYKIFESALGQHNLITVLEKGETHSAKCKVLNTTKKGFVRQGHVQYILDGTDESVKISNVEQTDLYEREEKYIRMIVEEGTNNTLSSIFHKIINDNDTLGDIANVNAGIMGGCDRLTKQNLSYTSAENISINDLHKDDGVFVLDQANKRDLARFEALLGKSYFQDFYKNSDIRKYCTICSTTKKIIFSSSTNTEEEKNEIKVSLAPFRTILEKIREINNEKLEDWYLIRRGATHPQIFNSPKIVAPQRSKLNTFGYNEVSWYASADVYFITDSKDGYQLKYILGLLNSRLYYLWLYNKGKRKGENLELYQKPLSEIPIKKGNDTQQLSIINLVDQILAAKKADPQADTSAWEAKIDILVYLFYGLTWDEVQIVENSSVHAALSINEANYSKWLERYQKDGTLPSEEEMEHMA